MNPRYSFGVACGDDAGGLFLTAHLSEGELRNVSTRSILLHHTTQGMVVLREFQANTLRSIAWTGRQLVCVGAANRLYFYDGKWRDSLPKLQPWQSIAGVTKGDSSEFLLYGNRLLSRGEDVAAASLITARHHWIFDACEVGAEVFAVGHSGLAIRSVDEMMVDEKLPWKTNLTAIAPIASSDFVAVGWEGTVLRRHSTELWKAATLSRPIEWNLLRLAKTESGDLYCAGNALYAVKDDDWTQAIEPRGWGHVAPYNKSQIVVVSDAHILVGPPWTDLTEEVGRRIEVDFKAQRSVANW